MNFVGQRKDSNFTYEVIVVDDGSRDSTSEVNGARREERISLKNIWWFIQESPW